MCSPTHSGTELLGQVEAGGLRVQGGQSVLHDETLSQSINQLINLSYTVVDVLNGLIK